MKGLALGNGEVLLNGLPLSQASGAEQLRLSMAIAMAGNPKLRVLRIKEGSLLDDDNLALLRDRRLSALLHHDLEHDLHMACLLLMQIHGNPGSAQVPRRSNVEVITPFNLPASVA